MISDNNDKVFYDLFGQLISHITDMAHPANIPAIEDLLVKISSMLRLSKGVTRLYRNPQEEKAGGGETLRCYDLGVESRLVHQVRVETSVMSIAEMKVYQAINEPPLTATEFERVDLVMRSVISYVSRNRLRDIVEELAYSDDDGFRNFKKMQSTIAVMNESGRLGGKAVILYNLRHFELVNMQYGRKCGDEVLHSHFANLEKILGEDGTVCRLGGDNFIAVFDKKLIDKALDYLTETVICFSRGSVMIRCRSGVFITPDHYYMSNIGDIMNRILSASSAARSENRSVVFYDDSIVSHREHIMRVQERFPEALKNEEFKVYYQPKVNILTGKLSGAEALCRWISDGNVIPPASFIPVLEQTNDICILDYYMLEHVCRDLRRWLDEGREVVRVSVNISRRHITNMELLGDILEIVDKYSIPHEYIEIELTETTDVEFTDLRRVVCGLSEAGIFTTIDDFGVGYSSINLIRGIPWNVLKLDKSFLPMKEENEDALNEIMFRYTINMSKEIGLECVAEGVETLRHLAILRENDCEQAQGFLFDKPLPADEFEKRMEPDFIYQSAVLSGENNEG